jgi:alcohol dehydrogenase (NADP+)
MRVDVIGVRGLGHLAVQFAHALGAEVTAISQSSRKKEDTVKMGVKYFIVTTEEGWVSKSARSLDLIICTSFSKEIPLAQYISLLDVGGTLVYVGIPEVDLPSLPPTLMIGINGALRGSNTGSKKEVLQMLDLVEKHDIKP